MKCSRREFLKVSGVSLSSACLGGICLSGCSLSGGLSKTPFAPLGSYTAEANRLVVDLEKAPELKRVGGSVKLSVDNPVKGTQEKIILVHPEDLTYKAFSNTCTHRGKELEYVHAKKRLECVSGHSEFDLEGRVLDGNAEAPLTVYPTELDGNTLTIYLQFFGVRHS